MTTPEERLGMLVKQAFSGQSKEFRRCAMFDAPLDCIRVIRRDCSVTEIRVNRYLTVLQDNHPASEAEKYVGFTVKGAKHFCKTHDFDLNAPVRLVKLLDEIVARSPELAVRLVVDCIAKPAVGVDDSHDGLDLSAGSQVVFLGETS